MNKCLGSLLSAAVLSLSPVSLVSADSDAEEFDIAHYVIHKSGIDFNEAYARVTQNYSGIVFAYELEDEDDRLVHEFEIMHQEERTKYKVEIDAQSGEIKEEKRKLRWAIFGKDKDLRLVEQVSAETLTLAEAATIAQQKFSEGSKVLLTDIELEYEQGLLYFEVEAEERTEEDTEEREWLVDAEAKTLIPTFKQD